MSYEKIKIPTQLPIWTACAAKDAKVLAKDLAAWIGCSLFCINTMVKDGRLPTPDGEIKGVFGFEAGIEYGPRNKARTWKVSTIKYWHRNLQSQTPKPEDVCKA